MMNDRRRNQENEEHRRVVEAGGGEYVRGLFFGMVMFSSKQTGTSLCIPEKDLTPEAVAVKLLVSNEAFGVDSPCTLQALRRKLTNAG